MVTEEDYELEELDDEEEDDEESEDEEEPVKIDKEWRIAGYEDTEKLRPLSRPRKVQIIISQKDKVYAELFIRDLTIDEQLTIEEAFISLDSGKETKRGKKGRSKIKINLKSYYRMCYEKSVVKTNPPHLKKWREIRRFSTRSGIFDQIKEYLPDPYNPNASIGNLDDDEVKN